jgi:hypothetical protein
MFITYCFKLLFTQHRIIHRTLQIRAPGKTRLLRIAEDVNQTFGGGNNALPVAASA